jgi:hypothetical protein
VVPADLEEAFAARWKDLAGWDVEEPPIPEPPRLRTAPPSSADEGSVAADSEASELPAQDDPESVEPPPANPVDEVSEPLGPAAAGAVENPGEELEAAAEPTEAVRRPAPRSRRNRGSRRRPRQSRRSSAAPDSARRGRR